MDLHLLSAQYTGLLGLIKSKKTMTELPWFQLRLLAFEVLENSILRSRAVLLRMVALGTAMTKNRLMYLISNLTPYS